MAKVPETVAEIEAALAHLTVYEAAVKVGEWLHPLPPPGSVRVRVAVGFAEDGEWTASGWKDGVDEDVVEDLHEACRRRVRWIEADIPPPVAEPVIAGRVVP